MNAAAAPFRPIDFAPPHVEVERRPDGTLILRSPIEVGPDGGLRLAAINACAPVIQDAVITGHDRADPGLLVFVNLAGCLSLVPDTDPRMTLAELVAMPEIRTALARGLAAHNHANPSTSTRLARVILLTTPPSIDANEITDKGYINQRAVLETRAVEVERLYSNPLHSTVVLPAA